MAVAGQRLCCRIKMKPLIIAVWTIYTKLRIEAEWKRRREKKKRTINENITIYAKENKKSNDWMGVCEWAE